MNLETNLEGIEPWSTESVYHIGWHGDSGQLQRELCGWVVVGGVVTTTLTIIEHFQHRLPVSVRWADELSFICREWGSEVDDDRSAIKTCQLSSNING